VDVIARNRDRFTVVGLAAGSDVDLLAKQAHQMDVAHVALADETVEMPASLAGEFRGPDAAVDLIRAVDADVILNGITGAVGLKPTLAALETGASLALANKESLIIGGELVKQHARPGQIVPVDSEHSAIAQALAAGEHREVRRLLVTASGGPFRGRSREDLEQVTPAQALHHPTWNMGVMVTTNSATLVNKGLEVIEAHLLFDIPFDQIEVVVHPQSYVHSMVEFQDGSTIAQVSPPDMRIPIALGLSWPEHIPDVAPAVDWGRAHTWTFEPLDGAAFTAVSLARSCGVRGGTFPAVFNAANEVAVLAFHAGKIRLPQIVDTIAAVVARHTPGPELSVDSVLGADRWARAEARSILGLE